MAGANNELAAASIHIHLCGSALHIGTRGKQDKRVLGTLTSGEHGGELCGETGADDEKVVPGVESSANRGGWTIHGGALGRRLQTGLGGRGVTGSRFTPGLCGDLGRVVAFGAEDFGSASGSEGMEWRAGGRGEWGDLERGHDGGGHGVCRYRHAQASAVVREVGCVSERAGDEGVGEWGRVVRSRWG